MINIFYQVSLVAITLGSFIGCLAFIVSDILRNEREWRELSASLENE